MCDCEVSNGNIGKSIFGKEEGALCAGEGRNCGKDDQMSAKRRGREESGKG